VPEHHVFGHCESIHETKVLVHHGDAVRQPVARAVETNLGSIAKDLAFFGAVQPAEH
jgi:hypothetical protein